MFVITELTHDRHLNPFWFVFILLLIINPNKTSRKSIFRNLASFKNIGLRLFPLNPDVQNKNVFFNF